MPGLLRETTGNRSHSHSVGSAMRTKARGRQTDNRLEPKGEATMSFKPFFRADQLGSPLRPKELLDARLDWKAGKISAEDLRAVED